jgi:hypothetical protein
MIDRVLTIARQALNGVIQVLITTVEQRDPYTAGRQQRVADVVEAMASHRPYRPALGIDAALEEMMNYRGTQFDADAVDACVKPFRKKDDRLKTSSY